MAEQNQQGNQNKNPDDNEKKQQQQDKEKEEEQQQQQKDQQSKQQQRQQQQRNKSAPSLNPLPPRYNKLYRAPPTPDRELLIDKERSFVLDSVAVSNISLDYSRANPKLGSVLPTYNSQRDRHVRNYFTYRGVPQVLRSNLQSGKLSCSIEGPVQDWFKEKGAGYRYLSGRQPNGHSNDYRMGHSKLWVHPNPTVALTERTPRELEGFNGRFGYRRTTPSLRKLPSPFGVCTSSPIY